jgi:transposase
VNLSMAKHYDKQFKLDAIKYRQTHPELSVAAVCRNLNISEPTYYKWSSEYKNDGDINHRGSGNFSNDLEKGNARLRKELQAKEDALRILKKAISILNEEPK